MTYTFIINIYIHIYIYTWFIDIHIDTVFFFRDLLKETGFGTLSDLTAYQPEAVLAATDAAKLCFGVGGPPLGGGLRRRGYPLVGVFPPLLEPFKKGHSKYPPWEPKTFIFGGFKL